ncbi:MAG: glycosyltransferase, partial [bacterium]
YIHDDLERMVDEKIAELNLGVNFRYVFHGDIGSTVTPGRPYPYGHDSTDVFSIVMASRFSQYQKRQDILVRAISMLDSSRPVSVKLVGDGATRAPIQAMIDSLDLRDRVAIVPFLPQKDLWKLMLDSHLMCHVSEWEGLGKIIIESMALGLPVLASNVRPLNRYIVEGVNGFLVENHPAAWARKIEELIADEGARAAVSSASIEYIRSYYDPSRNVTTYEKHFEHLVAQQISPSRE